VHERVELAVSGPRRHCKQWFGISDAGAQQQRGALVGEELGQVEQGIEGAVTEKERA
jgi:hypothetical protein